MSTLNQTSRSNLKRQTRLAFGLIPLLNYLKTQNVDTQAFLQTNGIREAEFFDPAFTISLEQELKIVEQAFTYLRHPSACLDLAKCYHLHNFSVLGLAIRSCSVLADVFELFLQYPKLQWGSCETRGFQEGELLQFELIGGKTQLEQFLLARDMACVKTLLSEAIGQPLDIQAVYFNFPKADASQQTLFENFFGCPVYFDQNKTFFCLPLEQMACPIPTADPLSQRFYEAQCARLSAELDAPFLYRNLVRDKLSSASPIPTLDALCHTLNFETRTLQRQLKKEGDSFSHILQEVRIKRAHDLLLRNQLSNEQIAYELGFKDAVAFSHAFKQWHGISPREYKKQTL